MFTPVKTFELEDFEAFLVLPENAERDFELIGGEVIEVVSHHYASEIAIRIATYIGMYLLAHPIGRLTGADGGYMVGGERYIPDVAFISYAHQPEPVYAAYNPLPPDLAVEVLSPTNEDEKMRIKINNYLYDGALVWVVNPATLTVEVYQPGKRVRVLRGDMLLDGGEVLPGFTLTVNTIFQR